MLIVGGGAIGGLLGFLIGYITRPSMFAIGQIPLRAAFDVNYLGSYARDTLSTHLWIATIIGAVLCGVIGGVLEHFQKRLTR